MEEAANSVLPDEDEEMAVGSAEWRGWDLRRAGMGIGEGKRKSQ